MNGTPPDRAERELWRSRPSWAAIVLRPLWLLIALALGIAGIFWFDGHGYAAGWGIGGAWGIRVLPGDAGGRWTRWASSLLAGLAVIVLLRGILHVASSEFVLTERRAVWRSGILRRLTVEVPLRRVQHVLLVRSFRERLAGLGTIGIASAGTDGIEIAWGMIARPEHVFGLVRAGVDSVGAGAGPVPDASDSPERRPANDVVVSQSDFKQLPRAPLPVIGLAGGIGSGKSTVGRMLAQLGCLVIDSDARAKAALDRPEVRETLVGWWGPGVLGPDGRINRAHVATIVFGSPAERQRLEKLVHPIVRQDRAQIIAEAAGGAFRAVVVDAPLLFEAGVDAECDRILFVDAPEDQRQARVTRTRGWDRAELARREAAQLPLEEKRRRSTGVVINDRDEVQLQMRVREALERTLAEIAVERSRPA